MITIIVASAIIVYIVSIAVLCHNAVPYQDSWDEGKQKNWALTQRYLKGDKAMDQSGKKNAERYLVIAKSGKSATVLAEDFPDALKELDESAEVDAPSFGKEDVKLIMVLD